ncbi:tachykinins-like isoform X2 [Anopheles funestus]|uniref:tachykinins-like isoform X2 n=1 Tax=Anopheles funestus TaxID=62324 RepID=UPI0020C67046|nr:tachykinins-like isoform X2 [Anopheles funestus]
MSRPFVMLACFAFLANVCVSVSGLSETPADVPEHPVDGIARPDDDRPNYMAFNENAFNDNDLPPPSPSPTDDSRMPPGDHGTDGLARGLYSWGGMPRWRISPELLDGLRAALEVENDMFMPHNEQLFRTAQNDNKENGRVDFGFGAERNLPKRAPTGFTGMRGRRVPSGFNGVRGKKSLSLFSWNNQASRGGPNSYRDGKRAPSGFMGMRGKKSFDNALDERWSLDELNSNQMAKEYPNFLVLDPAYGPSMHLNAAPPKRVPNGFMGLRGK